MSIDNIEKNLWTETQGQYLAFIFYYTKINRIPPAQRDFQNFFSVSPPTVHQMILILEKKGFISRTPNTPRSLNLLIPEEKLPRLK
jgi:Mn-dependent DtxR family transcriptional regulator